MADIPNATSNVTLYDENGNPIQVSLNALSGIYELRVKDKDVFDQLSQPSAASAPDLWQFYTLAQMGFSATIPLQTIAGQSETDFILFRNPTGSGKIIKFHDIDYLYNKGSGIAIVRMYLGPTITSVGTGVSVQKRYVGGAISPTSLVYYNPTISARGTVIRIFGQSAVASFTEEEHLGWIIPANTDMLITVQPAANNTDHTIYMDWAEVTP